MDTAPYSRGYWPVLSYVLEPAPLIRLARGARFAAWAAIVIGLLGLAQSWNAGTWAAWVIASGFVIAAAALGYLMLTAAGGLTGRVDMLSIAVLMAATLMLALVVVPLGSAEAETTGSSAWFALWLGCLLLSIDQIVYHWWVWRRGRGALGQTIMTEAYTGALKCGWVTDPETGNQLKAMTETVRDPRAFAPTTILERFDSTEKLYIAYQCGHFGMWDYGFAVHRYYVLGEEPSFATFAPADGREQSVRPLAVAEALVLADKIRRCEATAGASAATASASTH